jgi:hypothetical protein
MVVLAPRSKAHLALVLSLCGCPSADSPAITTTTGAQTDPAADTESAVPTTSATDLATTPDPATTTSSAGSVDTTTSTTTDASTSVSSTGEQTTTGSLEDCGDGQLQPGEQCDLGFGLNFDTGDCTSKCRLPSCGDGFVWTEHEICDSGDANNDTTWNGCKNDCTPGPRCNDGIVQPDNEECDDGPEWNGSGESKDPNHAPCTGECRISGRIMFISSTKFTGNLGGLSGADDLCKGLALGAGLDNHVNFIAWLSDGGSTAKSRIPEIDGDPFVMPDGTIVADDLEDLLTSGPRLGVYLDELGVSQELDPLAWTNTDGDGTEYTTALTNHCLGWASALANHTARLGLGFVPTIPEDMWTTWKINKWWSNYESRKCNYSFRLFCVEK